MNFLKKNILYLLRSLGGDNKKMKKAKEAKIKELLSFIKIVFLFGLTFLVVINTIILCVLVPFVGWHLSPDNQIAGRIWGIVSVIMEMLLTILVMEGIAYGTVKIMQKYECFKGDKK